MERHETPLEDSNHSYTDSHLGIQPTNIIYNSDLQSDACPDLAITPELNAKFKVLQSRLISCIYGYYKEGFSLDLRSILKIAQDVADMSDLSAILLKRTWLTEILLNSKKIPIHPHLLSKLSTNRCLELDDVVFSPRSGEDFFDNLNKWIFT